MKIKSIYSSKETVDLIAEELSAQFKENFNDGEARLVIYFASSNINPQEVAEKMEGIFGGADVIGCTTAGELTSGKMLKNSIVAMVFDSEAIEDAAIGIVEGIKEGASVEGLFGSFEEKYGSLKELDINKYLGVILIDGMSGAEERLMSKIGDLTDITFIGGSAGDDAKFKATYVFYNGKAYADSALLALLKVGTKFEILKTQSFSVSDRNLTATKVDEANREVIEFDGKPAVEAYAEALGIPAEKSANEFMTHPVGLMVGDEPYVRSPQQAIDGKIKFYCNVKEGAKLSVLDSTDIVEETSKALDEKVKAMGGASGIINFNCILRGLELEKEGKSQAYADLFSDIPTIGFNTYGEQYIGHINQTSTMILFK